MPGKNSSTDDLDDDDDDLQELGGGGANAQELAEDAEARASEQSGDGEEVVIEDEPEDKNDERVGAGVEGERTDRGQREAAPGRGRDGETAEQRQERRRQERKAAKQRQQLARNRDKSELQFLRNEIDRLHQGQGQLQHNQLVTQAQAIDNRIAYLDENIRKADGIIAQGIDGQNGDDVVKATTIRDNLVRSRDGLVVAKSQLAQQARRGNDTRQQQPRQEQPNPLMVAEFQRFRERHDWFDPSGKDEDSAIVVAIDNALSNEDAFDPATPAYWKELERRVRKRLPHAADGVAADDDDDDDDDEPAQRRGRGQQRQTNGRQTQQRRSGPRMPSNAGGNSNSGGKTFFVSAERKSAMIDAGVWDDPKLRARYVKKYAEWDAANAPRGR